MYCARTARQATPQECYETIARTTDSALYSTCRACAHGQRLMATVSWVKEGGADASPVETPGYSVWTALLAFFEEGQDGRVDSALPGPRPSAPALRAVPHSAFLRNGQPPLQKRTRALPNEKTRRFRNPFNELFPINDTEKIMTKTRKTAKTATATATAPVTAPTPETTAQTPTLEAQAGTPAPAETKTYTIIDVCERAQLPYGTVYGAIRDLKRGKRATSPSHQKVKEALRGMRIGAADLVAAPKGKKTRDSPLDELAAAQAPTEPMTATEAKAASEALNAKAAQTATSLALKNVVAQAHELAAPASAPAPAKEEGSWDELAAAVAPASPQKAGKKKPTFATLFPTPFTKGTVQAPAPASENNAPSTDPQPDEDDPGADPGGGVPGDAPIGYSPSCSACKWQATEKCNDCIYGEMFESRGVATQPGSLDQAVDEVAKLTAMPSPNPLYLGVDMALGSPSRSVSYSVTLPADEETTAEQAVIRDSSTVQRTPWGREMYQARAELGISLRELSGIAGVTASRLSEAEFGLAVLTPEERRLVEEELAMASSLVPPFSLETFPLEALLTELQRRLPHDTVINFRIGPAAA